MLANCGTKGLSFDKHITANCTCKIQILVANTTDDAKDFHSVKHVTLNCIQLQEVCHLVNT